MAIKHLCGRSEPHLLHSPLVTTALVCNLLSSGMPCVLGDCTHAAVEDGRSASQGKSWIQLGDGYTAERSLISAISSRLSLPRRVRKTV